MTCRRQHRKLPTQAKHWLAGHHGPDGDYLLVLMSESDTVFEAILAAAGRHDTVVAARILAAHGTMLELMAMLERESAGPTRDVPQGADLRAEHMITGADVGENVRVNVRVNPSPADGLNPRQRWFLAALEAGRDVAAPDLARWWDVSERTARRDVAALTACGMIEFTDSCRTRGYRLKR